MLHALSPTEKDASFPSTVMTQASFSYWLFLCINAYQELGDACQLQGQCLSADLFMKDGKTSYARTRQKQQPEH